MDDNVKEVRVTGDAATYLEPKKKRTRRAKRVVDLLEDPLEEPVEEPVKKPVKEVVKEVVKEPIKEVVKIVAKEPVKEVVKIMPKAPKPSIPLTKTRKRQFKAKKISLLIAEADPKTRKARKVIAKKVADMGLEELRTQLETQGLIKHGKKHVPEDMLRSMMRDALTLSEGK